MKLADPQMNQGQNYSQVRCSFQKPFQFADIQQRDREFVFLSILSEGGFAFFPADFREG